jgi:hypothetical protein
MKISPKSKKLMLFFTKNKHIHQVRQTKKTQNILTELYYDIFEAYKHLIQLKKKLPYFSFTIQKIINANKISKPQNFNSNAFPDVVRKHIDLHSAYELTYTFSLYNRKIKIIFVVEDVNVELKLDTYHKYVDSIIMWMCILNKYASKTCSKTLVVYLYFTSLEKKIPLSNIYTLNEIHVNTAFTTTCPKDSEIVIFRHEEWLKVLIHESFHNFALDFSDMDNRDAHNYILNIFRVKSDVNLYESYTEFWAEIMNALFCSFFSLKDKTDIADFLKHSHFFINFERTYSFFQMVKVLRFMGLEYKDLYLTKKENIISRENLYKENTSVLSYYIIKCILMNNYQGFLSSCKTNNSTLLQFKKTVSNQLQYCKFIENNYRTKTMLENVRETENFFYKNNKNNKNNKLNNQNFQYILSNLRMSICELG